MQNPQWHQQEVERDNMTRAIVDSPAHRRLVVAGPGTGKSTAFRFAFREVGGSGLALTFIGSLAKVLGADLPQTVHVDTFHGFCYWRFKTAGNQGKLYGPLLEILSDDISRMRDKRIGRQAVEWAFHDMDDRDLLIRDAIARSVDYGAVSHPGVVYRMVEAFGTDTGLIPTFPLVVIDEVQDFTQLEIELLHLLSTKSRILVAGDDDQSLYGFRHASPGHLHTMWQRPDFTTFKLAYCSRCTEVIVAAVNDVVRAAQRRGLLANRIDKRYECYLPTKAEDSQRFPALVHSRLPRQTEANEIGRYIVDEIARIPERDIAQSRQEGYPTALVVGPDPFLEYATNAVRSAYPQTVVTRRDDDPFRIDPLDGYRFLATEHDSKLGWRILLYCFFKLEAQDRMDEALRTGGDIVNTMPQAFRTENEPFVEAIGRLMSGLDLADAQARALEKRLDRPIDEIKQRLLRGAAASADAGTTAEALSASAYDKPSITCATLLGAKGLSGGHVFVAGCVDGFLPRRADSIQNEEVCQFLVALSRTRKECHLISVDSFLGRRWNASSFLTWIQQPWDLRTR